MLGIMFSVAALWLLPLTSYWSIGTTFFFIAFFIFGLQMLTGMAAAGVTHKEYAGTATGFVGLSAIWVRH